MRLADLLLNRGWFPRELPPPFQTSRFAAAIAAGGAPDVFANSQSPKGGVSFGIHSLPRYSGLRRDVHLVNPVSQCGLATTLETAWAEIQKVTSESPFSASSPRMRATGRALDRAVPRAELPIKRAQHRLGARWLLRADVSRFYPTIYTHSVPWALHTKTAAKKDRTDNLVGNVIDAWLRKGQRGQTMGIPVGPDTSLAIAESILSAVDVALAADIPGVRAFRYMDDYEIVTDSHDDALKALHALQRLLGEYELALNPGKTAIVALPFELQRPWAARLRRLQIRADTNNEEADLISYFDAAFEYTRRYPGEPVLNFALAQLRSWEWVVRESSRRSLEALMLQAMVLEPGTHRYVIEYFTDELPVTDRDTLERVFSSHVVFQARIGHSNEVAWAVWAALALGLHLDASVGSVVSVIDDDVVALLALHAESEGMISNLDTTLWKSRIASDELTGIHWMLAYECIAKNWLGGGLLHAAVGPAFEWMLVRGVEFYDRQTSAEMSEEMLEPEAGWEDAASG